MKRIFLYSTLALSVILSACKQTEVEDPEDQTQTGTEDVIPTPDSEEEKQAEEATAFMSAPVAFSGSFVEVSSAMLQTANTQKNAPQPDNGATPYPIVTWTPQDGTWPITLTADYGTSGVVGSDGLEHTGVLTITATDKFENQGSVITPVLDKFYVYGNTMSGKQVITNKGKNERGNLVYEVKVDDGIVGEDELFVYSENTLRELVRGLQEDGTLSRDITSHQYSITGQMKGKSQNDSIPDFDVQISAENPMLIAVGDLYPSAGLLNVTFMPAWVIDMSGAAEETGMMFPNFSVEKLTLEFLGREESGPYNMEANIPISIGFMQQTVRLTFSVNADGIIPESIKYEFVQE